MVFPYGFMLQHAGFGYCPAVISTAVIILSKDTLFNRYILTTKFLLLWGDISYPFYLWHYGIQSITFGVSIYQIYGKALIFTVISVLYVEPIFRKSNSKWAVPFLVLAQIVIFVKAYLIYSANS